MIPEAAYNRYLASLLEGNRGGCRRIVEELLALGVPVRELYRDLFHESLYEVGRLWESGQATVAVEHMATAITESLIALVFPTAIAFTTQWSPGGASEKQRPEPQISAVTRLPPVSSSTTQSRARTSAPSPVPKVNIVAA